MNFKAVLGILAIALAAVVLLNVGSEESSSAVDDTFSSDGLSYVVTGQSGGDGNTVTVTGFSGETIENLVIPDTVTHSAVTYNVTKIGTSAFAAKGIKTVNVGSVTEIGAFAFSGCIQLTQAREMMSATSVSLHSLAVWPSSVLPGGASMSWVHRHSQGTSCWLPWICPRQRPSAWQLSWSASF